MSIRFKLRGVILVFVLGSARTLCGQPNPHRPADGGSLQSHYNQAQDLQRAGKLPEAADQYRAFLADALSELAVGYGLLHDDAHARPLFEEALTLQPNSPALVLNYARTVLTAGDSAQAERLASEFIAKYPTDRVPLAQAYQILGRSLLKLNRNQEARKALEKAVALDPSFPNGYDLAVACLDLGDEKCATQLFSEMQKSFGDTPTIHMAFGRAYAESDFQPRAVTEFRRAVQENPRLPRAHYLLAAVLLATGAESGHTEEAEAELKKELINSPRDAVTYAALGEIAVNSHHYPEAEIALRKSIALGSRTPDAYLYLGQMYFATSRFADAEKALRQCIQLTTDPSRNRYQVQKAHFLLGRVLMQKGQQDAAHAEMAIARDLANKTLSQDKGKLAALTDNSPSADAQPSAPATDAAATSPPVNKTTLHEVESTRARLSLPIADSYNNLGAIAATNNDYVVAVKFFEHSSTWNPSLEGLDYNWGRAAFAGSQFAEAVAPLSRYIKSHPDDIGGRAVLGISQFMANDYRGCIATLEPSTGKSDLAPQAEYVYAESLVKVGRISGGAERLRTLARTHPEIPDVHHALAEVLSQQGDKAEANKEMETYNVLRARAQSATPSLQAPLPPQ